MQGLGSRRRSNSTIRHLKFHRSSTPEISQASSFSTLVEHAAPASDASSLSYVSSFSGASLVSDFVWPWWEAEAQNILRGLNLHAIQLLCRYGTYSDRSVPTSILRSRWKPILNNLLLQLSAGAFSRSDIDNLEVDQKIHEILERLLPPVPATKVWRDLVSPSLLLEPDASRLSSKLNKESSLRFRKITFVDCVREELYSEESVESIVDFVNWHDSLFNIISSRLEELPEETVKYMKIAQWLREGTPVRWAVLESLRQAQDHCPSLVVAPQPDLGFIYSPLRDHFRDQHGGLVETLAKLGVLEARFQRWYSSEEEIDWAQSFDTNTDLFDSVRTLTPQDLADSMTEQDTAVFETLCPRNITRQDSQFRYLNTRWNQLCQAAQETITVDQGLGPLLADLAKELHKRHNYYSLIAVLQALRENSFEEAQLSPLFHLIETDQNYATYRNVQRTTPGLPFLPPYIQQLKHNERKALYDIFSFLLRQPSRAQRQELGGKEREDLHKKLSWTAWTWAKIKIWVSCSTIKLVKESGGVCQA